MEYKVETAAEAFDYSDVENIVCGKCRKTEVGTLGLNGIVHLGDPCYVGHDAELECVDLNVLPGNYKCSYWTGTLDYDHDGKHYHDNDGRAIGIYLDGNIPDVDAFEFYGRSVGVDSGTLGFFNTDDTIVLNTRFRDEKYLEDTDSVREGQLTDDAFYWHTDDFDYPVFIAKNENGEIYAIEIREYSKYKR